MTVRVRLAIGHAAIIPAGGFLDDGAILVRWQRDPGNVPPTGP